MFGHWRCCCDGDGGGDELCCLCWDRWFQAPSDGLITNGSSTFDASGQIASICCSPQAPEGEGGEERPCVVIEFSTPDPSDTFDDVRIDQRTGARCDVVFNAGNQYDHTFFDCTGEPVDFAQFTDVRGWTDVIQSRQQPCPRFRVPQTGVILRGPGGDSSEIEVLMWDGADLQGPLCWIHTGRIIWTDAGSTLGFSDCYWIVNAFGGAASIARVRLICSRGKDFDGCTQNSDSCNNRPIRIDGSFSASGSFNSDGTVQTSASGSFSFLSWCESLGEECYRERVGSEDCIGFPTTETGTTSGDLAAAAAVNLAPALQFCPPTPDGDNRPGRDRDVNLDPQPIGPIDNRIIVPPDWTGLDPEFDAAIEMLRDYFTPIARRVPPPGGFGGGGRPAEDFF